MAVAFDTVGGAFTDTSNPGTGAHTWTHTVGAGGDTAAIVWLMFDQETTNYTIAVSFGGTSMSLLGGPFLTNAGSGQGQGYCYGAAGVAAGSNTVTVTLSGSGFANDVIFNSISFTGAAQTSTFGSFFSAAAKTVTLTSTSTTGLCCGSAMFGNNITATTSPATSRYVDNLEGSNGAAMGNMAIATSPSTGSSVTMGWSTSSTDFAAAAVEVLAAAAAAPIGTSPTDIGILILQQYGLDQEVYESPLAGEPMITARGASGNLDFEASATAYTSAYSAPPPTDLAALILHQYGLDAPFFVPVPSVSIPTTQGAGSGNLDFEASATGYETAYSQQPPTDLAVLILQQYGLDAAVLVTPQAGAPMVSGTGSGNLDFEASGLGYESAYSVPPPTDLAALILHQYGLDAPFFVAPPTQLITSTNGSGTGNLDFEASATGFETAYSVPPPTDTAVLILRQYGLDQAVLVAPNAGAPMLSDGGTGSLTFAGSATGYETAYSVPPPVDIAVLILRQYGVDATLAVPPHTVSGNTTSGTGTGNMDLEGSATAVVKEIGVDFQFQLLGPAWAVDLLESRWAATGLASRWTMEAIPSGLASQWTGLLLPSRWTAVTVPSRWIIEGVPLRWSGQ